MQDDLTNFSLIIKFTQNLFYHLKKKLMFLANIWDHETDSKGYERYWKIQVRTKYIIRNKKNKIEIKKEAKIRKKTKSWVHLLKTF